MNEKEDKLSLKKIECKICKDNAPTYCLFSCGEKICSLCVYRLIFTHFIKKFENLTNNKTIICPCSKGELTLNNNQIYDILRALNSYEKKKTAKEKCQIHSDTFKEHFCLDCNEIVCKKCSENKADCHFAHSIKNLDFLIDKLRHNKTQLPLKYKTYEEFASNFEKIGKKIQDVVDGSYTATIKSIDSSLQSLTNFRSEYITKYKRILEEGVKLIKILKIFYLNYYYSSERSEKINDIYLLKFVNSISNEFDDVNIEHNTGITVKINWIKEEIERLRNELEKSIKMSMSFVEVNKSFVLEQKLENAHKKIISSLVQYDDNTFISGSRDYTIKFWTEQNYSFQKSKTISEFTGSILCMSILKDKRIISSSSKDGNIRVWSKEEDGEFQCQQTLSGHNGPVTCLDELPDGRIISGSIDKGILIWSENEGCFQVESKLSRQGMEEVYCLKGMFDSRVVSGGADSNVIIWKEFDGEFYSEQCLSKHRGRVLSVTQIKDGRIVSGGDVDYELFVWKEKKERNDEMYFSLEMKVKGHSDAINVIILMHDGRFASASNDKSIIIWEYKNKKGQDKTISISEKLLGVHTDNIFTLLELEDGRLCSAGKDNLIAIWKNFRE